MVGSVEGARAEEGLAVVGWEMEASEAAGCVEMGKVVVGWGAAVGGVAV